LLLCLGRHFVVARQVLSSARPLVTAKRTDHLEANDYAADVHRYPGTEEASAASGDRSSIPKTTRHPGMETMVDSLVTIVRFFRFLIRQRAGSRPPIARDSDLVPIREGLERNWECRHSKRLSVLHNSIFLRIWRGIRNETAASQVYSTPYSWTDASRRPISTTLTAHPMALHHPDHTTSYSGHHALVFFPQVKE